MKKNQEGFSLIEILLILLALGIIGFVGWYVYNSQKGVDSSFNNAADSTSEKKEKKAEEPAADEPVISEALKENTAAAIESQNTAALEGYMAESVNVVFAASEKGGPVTPTQAIADLAYLQAATSPWDFNLPTATLDSYKAGFYKDYFGTNTIVGKSANDYVVSFGVNSAGKIDAIFVAASADLLL